jgi:Fe(3+) dicitrate transport protein
MPGLGPTVLLAALTSTATSTVGPSATTTSAGGIVADEPDPGQFAVLVRGKRLRLPRIVGSAHAIDEKTLERYEHTDVHRVLGGVPGVYVRNEDGFGLRPNIGLRGANSDRSAKVTLMEDGIPASPAPYSANAAYYFPLMARVRGVEVYKGPGSTRFGPHTIGGAINLLTSAVPEDGFEGDLKLGLGLDMFGEVLGRAGWGNRDFGLLAEGVHVRSDGFKALDGGGDTGFARTDLLVKGRLRFGGGGAASHGLEAVASLGLESSDETYLGLTDADLATTPLRRYAASQLDLMDWTRLGLRASYVLDTSALELRLTVYRNTLSRAWRKLNRFGGGAPALDDILRSPSGSHAAYYAVLTGQNDSDPSLEALSLMIGTNDRRFFSQGVAAVARSNALRLAGTVHRIELGARLHNDGVERYQYEDPHLMASGRLVATGSPRVVNTDERGTALALALHIMDEARWGDLTLVPGLRAEVVATEMDGLVTRYAGQRTDVALLPSFGVHYRLTAALGVFGGVHVGFSPVAPGQAPGVEPEKSLSFEAGARLLAGGTKAEVVGFVSDYSNLVGTCGQSAGCDEVAANQQYSGGAAQVYGVEVSLRQEERLPADVQLYGELSYTLTGSQFLTDLRGSGFPLFEGARVGDELPYVPLHQASLVLGATHPHFDVSASARFLDRMRDRYGSGAEAEADYTDRYVVVDAVAAWLFGDGRLYLKADNVLNATYASSRRPFGARPGAPFFLSIGYKHHFE